MCFFSQPSTPAPPPPPPAPPSPPKKADPAVKEAKKDARTRAALAQGRESDVGVGQLTKEPVNQSKKQLLGL